MSNQSWGAQPSSDSAGKSETAEPKPVEAQPVEAQPVEPEVVEEELVEAELVEAELVEAETVETIIDVEVLDAEVFEDIQRGEVVPAPSPSLGAAALGLAAVTAIVHIIAVVVSSANDFDLGTTLGYVAIGLSVLAVVLGALAVILDRGRRLGVASVALGLVANPYILLLLLQLVGGAGAA